jgi:hypothetical protein
MKSKFTKLNIGWNAEPNVAVPKCSVENDCLIVRFKLNPYLYPEFSYGDIGVLRFEECSRYRIGTVNDEGWYRGKCRFSKLAPEWGEFYKIEGNLLLEHCPNDWIELKSKSKNEVHFLFYFRDMEFECSAEGWTFEVEYCK